MSLAESKNNYIDLILDWLSSNNNSNSVDFTQPYIRRSLRYVYPLFVFLHAAVGIVGIVGNIAMIIVLGKRRLYHDQTFFLLGNLAFSDLIKCVFVLPITLANLLIQNWLFGSFLCFFLPMLQCFPMYASMMTFLMMAIDRYRLIVHPFKSRLPAGLCTIAVWVVAVCVVLPFAVYIKYIDLGASLGEHFEGAGICYVFLVKKIEEYIRAIFVTMYAMPLAVIAFLYVRVSAEIKSRESANISVHFASNTGEGMPSMPEIFSYQSSTTWSSANGAQTPRNENETTSASSSVIPQLKSYEHNSQEYDDDLDLVKEKRTQNYLISMTTLFAMCWCPLQILILVHYFIYETERNQDHYDITYITFAWFGFLSTCTNPILFASWRMSSETKDRLRGYFRFSNRRRSSQVSRTDVSNIPRTPSSSVRDHSPLPSLMEHSPLPVRLEHSPLPSRLGHSQHSSRTEHRSHSSRMDHSPHRSHTEHIPHATRMDHSPHRSHTEHIPHATRMDHSPYSSRREHSPQPARMEHSLSPPRLQVSI